MSPRKPPRRRWRSGSITWLTPSKVVLRVRTSNGVRSKTVTLAHRRDQGGRGDAEEALAAFAEEVRAPVRANANWTLNDAFDAYVDDAERLGRRGGTLTSYRQVKDRLGDYGQIPISDLTSLDLDRLYGDLAKRKYAPSTIKTTHQVIAAVLERAVEWQKVPINVAPAARVQEPLRKARTQLTPTDFWALVTSTDDPVLAIAIFLAGMTGARRAELSGLRWEDVDVEGCGIFFRRQWAVGPDGRKVVQDLKSATGTDGSGQRWVWIGQHAIDALGRYRDRLQADLGIEPDGWLLSDNGGATPVKPNSLGARMTKHCRDGGYDVTPHDFRRFTASELVAGGADVAAAADRMGHTPQMMMGRYTKARRDKAIAAGQALEARLGLPIGDLLAP